MVQACYNPNPRYTIRNPKLFWKYEIKIVLLQPFIKINIYTNKKVSEKHDYRTC